MRWAWLQLAMLSGCAAAPPAPSPPVVLMTDFGLRDDAVGLMRGVVLSIAPGAPLVDLTHEVARFDVREGSRLLADAPHIYPAGSVFCVVVDPGVGSDRRAVVARLPNGTLIVAPDNGVLSGVAALVTLEVRKLTNDSLLRSEMSATFHGRDLFAPLAAHLAAGAPFAEVGPVVEDWIRLEPLLATREGDRIQGVVVAIDEPFGNVWTNIPAEWLDLERERVTVQIAEREALELPVGLTFSDVPTAQPLVYINSRGRVSLALNMGDFARKHSVQRGDSVQILP